MKKVLGDIVGGFPGENTPLVPRILPPGPAAVPTASTSPHAIVLAGDRRAR